MSEFYVYKYGGTSAAQPEVAAAMFCADSDQNRVAVMSAVGRDRTDRADTVKGTAWLARLESAVDTNDGRAITEAQEAFIEKNRKAYRSVDGPVLRSVLDDAYEQLHINKREQGYQWLGERVSARLFAALIDGIYVPSDLKFVSGEMRVRQSMRDIRTTLVPALKSSRQIVTEGFIGSDMESGSVVTLPHGGSDISGVIYTAALNGLDGHKWVNINSTDKDGVLDADPEIVRGARVVKNMTHEEVREMMHGITVRNGVIHGDAIAYASTLNVEIFVRNTFNPDSLGTHITATRCSDPSRPIIGVSGKDNINAIDVFDMGMADASGYFGDVLGAAGKVGASVAAIPKSEDRMRLVFNGGDNRKALEKISGHIRRNAISGRSAVVETLHNQGSVYLVGDQLTDKNVYTHTIGAVATLMASQNFAIREITSHEKSPSLAMTVDGDKVQDIIRLLHGALIAPHYSQSS
jgi:aspartate kinase